MKEGKLRRQGNDENRERMRTEKDEDRERTRIVRTRIREKIMTGIG